MRSRILIVDDYPDIAALFAQILSGRHDCDCAAGGAEAWNKYHWAKLQGRPFDLILLDLAMPEQSGIEVAADIRNEGDTTTRLVFLTAYPDPEVASAAQRWGVRGFWKKPIDPADLREWVADVLYE